MSEAEMIKRNSKGLRGTILETLKSGKSHFAGGDANLIKFHGMYQCDDRDERLKRMKAHQEEAWVLMVRTKIPGGSLTAKQYLALDEISGKLANGTLRITTRQDIQFHGVLIGDVQDLVKKINQAEVTTFGGCGDVARNVVAPAAPFHRPELLEVQRTARELSAALLPRTQAYFETWLNGQKLERATAPEELDPLYTDAYLPRKFKIALMVPPDNDVDIYAHDLGLVAHLANGRIEGYTVLAGGGFGMDHGKKATFPFLALPLFYVPKERVLEAVKAVITAFRDYGDRQDRKHARLKYVIAERGVDWFRQRVQWRMNGPAEPARPFQLGSVSDRLGWHAQGDPEGRLFCGVRVECGRIKDYDEGPLSGVQYRTAFRAIVEAFQCPVRLTANQNLFLHDLAPSAQPAVEALLKAHGVPRAEDYTQAGRMGIACVALPTCHLALSESERAFTRLMARVEALLRELKIENEHILFRMTGCPNGCARPYNADFAFVGRGMNKYAVYAGGSHRGDRMAGLLFRTVNLDDLPARIRPFLEQYARERKPAETFSDWWGRTHTNGLAPHPDQFHEELAARAAKLAAAPKSKLPVG